MGQSFLVQIDQTLGDLIKDLIVVRYWSCVLPVTELLQCSIKSFKGKVSINVQ